MLASFIASTTALSPPPSSPRSPSPPCDCHDWENSSSFADADGAPVKVKACCETCSAFVKEGACATARYNDTLEAFNPWVFCKRTGQEFLPPWARDPNHPGWGRGSRGGRGGGRGRPPLQNVTLGRHHGVVGEGGSCKDKANSHQTLTWVLALSVALGMLIAAVVLLVLCYRRFSRDRANLRISRDRANLDLQMISHQVQRVYSASLPDSLSAKRFISLAKVPTASLPPGPPSSSAGQSVAEQEVTRSGAADSGVAPAALAPLVAPTVGPSPSLHHANYLAPLKRPAQPESASAPRAKKAFTSPWHVYCQEQRPLLMPLGMRNRDREKLLGVLVPSIALALALVL